MGTIVIYISILLTSAILGAYISSAIAQHRMNNILTNQTKIIEWMGLFNQWVSLVNITVTDYNNLKSEIRRLSDSTRDAIRQTSTPAEIQLLFEDIARITEEIETFGKINDQISEHLEKVRQQLSRTWPFAESSDECKEAP